MSRDALLVAKASIWGFLVPMATATAGAAFFGLNGPVVYLSVVAFFGVMYEFVLKKENLYLPTAAAGLIVAFVLWLGYSVVGPKIGTDYEVVEHSTNGYVVKDRLF